MNSEELARIFSGVASQGSSTPVIEHLRSKEITLDTKDPEGNTLLAVAETCGNWSLLSDLLARNLLPEGYKPPEGTFRSMAKAYEDGYVKDQFAALYPFELWAADSVFGKDKLKDELAQSAIGQGFWPMRDVETDLDLEVNTNVALAVVRMIYEVDGDNSGLEFLANTFNCSAVYHSGDTSLRDLNVWGTFDEQEIERLCGTECGVSEFGSALTILSNEQGILFTEKELAQSGIFHLEGGQLVSARLDALKSLSATSDYF